MSKASDLIERAEREGGGRWDDPKSNAMAVLFGALAREMGMSQFRDQDDLAAGMLIMDEMENGKERQRINQALLAMLGVGFSPDDIHALAKKSQ